MARIDAQVIRGVTSLYAVQLLTLPLGLLSNVLAGNWLSPGDYGGFATAVFVVSVAMMLSDASLATALIRSPEALEEGDLSSAFSYQLGMAALVAAFLMLGSGTFGAFFGTTPELPGLLRELAPLPILSAFVLVPLVKLERELNYGRIAALTGGVSVIERISLIAFMAIGAKGHSYVYSRLLGVALQAVVLSRMAPWSPISMLREVLSRGWHGRKHLAFGWTLQLKNLAAPIGGGVIPAVGGRWFGTEIVGLLSWSHNLANMIGLQLPQLAGRVLVGSGNQIRKQASESFNEEARGFSERMVWVCSIIAGGVLAALAGVFPELLELVFDPRWKGSASYFAVACLVMVAAVPYLLYDSYAVMLGMARLSMVATLSWAISTLGFGIGFATLIGPSGLIWAHFGATWIAIAVFHVGTPKSLRLRLHRCFAVPFSVSLLVYALIRNLIPMTEVPGLRVILGVLISTAFVLVQILLFRKMHRENKSQSAD